MQSIVLKSDKQLKFDSEMVNARKNLKNFCCRHYKCQQFCIVPIYIIAGHGFQWQLPDL